MPSERKLVQKKEVDHESIFRTMDFYANNGLFEFIIEEYPQDLREKHPQIYKFKLRQAGLERLNALNQQRERDINNWRNISIEMTRIDLVTSGDEIDPDDELNEFPPYPAASRLTYLNNAIQLGLTSLIDPDLDPTLKTLTQEEIEHLRKLSEGSRRDFEKREIGYLKLSKTK
jgi:hypothetical protein